MEPTNTSGSGKAAQVPKEIKKWNWGAFFANWMWGIGNRTYSALLAAIPLVGWLYAIVLGLKGSEWAWQNKRWKSIEHFKRVQRIWAIVGLLYFIFFVFVTVGLLSTNPPGPAETESAAQIADESDEKDSVKPAPKKDQDTKDESSPVKTEPGKTTPSPDEDKKTGTPNPAPSPSDEKKANSPNPAPTPSAEPKLKYDPHGPDRDCKDFSSPEEAQAFFEAAGPGDPHRLDRDKDGVACNSN